MMSDMLQRDLDQLNDKGLLRTLKSRTHSVSRLITINGREVLNFCSNDYLGLAEDARLVTAANVAMQQYGFGSGASRLVSGNIKAVEILEEKIAQLKHADECLVFNSGYNANTGIIPALVGREDIVFSDKLNHASIVDGIILSRAEMKRYAHVDMSALEETLKNNSKYRRRLIVTDSVFSMDGDVAPIKAIVDLAKRYDAWVMTDEAHSFGILDSDIEGIDIRMGTLSKAVGSFGAYVCGKTPLRSYLVNHARSFIYTTALPAAVIGASTQAIDIIASHEGDKLRLKVLANADFVRNQLKAMGFDTLNSTTPIIPVILKEESKAIAVSKLLLDAGIYVSAIRPPTVPINTARLRITVTARHTAEDLELLLNVMRKI